MGKKSKIDCHQNYSFFEVYNDLIDVVNKNKDIINANLSSLLKNKCCAQLKHIKNTLEMKIEKLKANDISDKYLVAEMINKRNIWGNPIEILDVKTKEREELPKKLEKEREKNDCRKRENKRRFCK